MFDSVSLLHNFLNSFQVVLILVGTYDRVYCSQLLHSLLCKYDWASYVSKNSGTYMAMIHACMDGVTLFDCVIEGSSIVQFYY